MTVVVAIAGLIVGVLGAVLAVAAMRRARRMVAMTARRLRSELAASGPLDPRAIRDVAVVRYDALEEMAGQLSFSVALLNAHGDGVVLTSINGRTETRTYAKVVAEGTGVHQLSPEEEQAVRSAQLGHGPPTLLTQAPRLVGGHGPVRPSSPSEPARSTGEAAGAADGSGNRSRSGPAAREPDGSRRPGPAERTVARGAGPDANGAASPDGQPDVPGGRRKTAPGNGAKRAASPRPEPAAAPGTEPAAAGTTAAKPGTGAGPGTASPPAGKPGPAPGDRTAGPDGPAREPVGRRLPKGA